MPGPLRLEAYQTREAFPEDGVAHVGQARGISRREIDQLREQAKALKDLLPDNGIKVPRNLVKPSTR